MDVGLPDLDGITATRIIRKYLNGIEIPIIAVTAFGKPYYERAIEAGCNDLIPKPVDFDSLQPILYRYLGH
jgi:CheY-like chemotaxis protein